MTKVPEVFTVSIIIDLMMESVSTSETSVNFYQTTRRNIPKDSHLKTRPHENLKSQKTIIVYSKNKAKPKYVFGKGKGDLMNIKGPEHECDLRNHKINHNCDSPKIFKCFRIIDLCKSSFR
jgi:hypothetical protein